MISLAGLKAKKIKPHPLPFVKERGVQNCIQVFLNASANNCISDSCDDCVNYLNEKANWGLRK
jgi:hypothetical protein